MQTYRILAVVATTAAMAFSPLASFAQDVLSALEVRTLIVGNTIEVQRNNGTRYVAYHEPSGIWLRQEGERIFEGKWRILDDGNQCVAIGRDDSCAQIQKNADGTFTRIQNGKVQFMWLRVLPGKTF